MVRIFVAIRMPELPLLEQWVGGFKGKSFCQEVKWTMPEFWHVTLCFIGNVDASVLPELSQSLSEIIKVYSSGTLFVRGMGFFGRLGHSRVLWAGVESDDWLMALHALIQEGVAVLGLSCGLNVFKPHITLGRIKKGSYTFRMDAEVKKKSAFKWARVEVPEVVLYQSVQTNSGPVYSVLESFGLAH